MEHQGRNGRAAAAPRRAAKRASKTAFACPAYGLKAWARDSARLICIGPEGREHHKPALMLATKEAAED